MKREIKLTVSYRSTELSETEVVLEIAVRTLDVASNPARLQ